MTSAFFGQKIGVFYLKIEQTLSSCNFLCDSSNQTTNPSNESKESVELENKFFAPRT